MKAYLLAGGLPFLRIDQHGDAWVEVVVVPNASRTQPTGIYGEPGREAVRIRLKAVPEGGKANHALIKWLADCLDVPPKAITLVRGGTSRRKQLRLGAATASVARWDKLMEAIAG